MKLGPGQGMVVKLEKLIVHKCDKCPQVFPNKSELKKHLLYHDELFLSHVLSAYVSVERAKLFKCDRCTRSFDNNRDFMLHKLSHVQENVRIERSVFRNRFLNNKIAKPYKCPDCDISFAAKSTLHTHSVLHLPFPHICDCGIGYYKADDLKGHIKLVHKKETKIELNFTPNGISTQEEQVIKPKPQTDLTSKPRKGPKLNNAVPKKKHTKKKGVHVKIKLKDDSTNENDTKIIFKAKIPDIDIRKTPDDKYECPECKKLFYSKSNLFIHYRIHSGERPYQCHLCPKAFTQGGTLKLHLEAHMTTEKKYACRHCPKAFTLPCYRDRHEDIHSPIKANDCPYCGKAFHDKSALVRHKRIHTGDKRYRCPYCPQAFSDVSGLRGHKQRHEKKKHFQCEVCQKRFYDRAQVRNHMVVHTNERNFTCDYCKRQFSNKGNLMSHIVKHMTVKKQFKCEECHRKYLTKGHMLHHFRLTHKTGKPEHSREFECDDCSKIFIKKWSLLKHYRNAHLGLRCDMCFRYFANKALYKAHRLVENAQCEICDEQFPCRYMKEKHFKVHFEKCELVIKSEADILKEI